MTKLLSFTIERTKSLKIMQKKYKKTFQIFNFKLILSILLFLKYLMVFKVKLEELTYLIFYILELSSSQIISDQEILLRP